MGKTYQSGTKTTKDRRGQIAPSPVAGQVTQPSLVKSFATAPPDRGQLIPRMNKQALEPAAGSTAYRVQRFERHGAAFRVNIPLSGGTPSVTPAGVKAPPAAATQARGRIVNSYPKMDAWSGRGFWEGTQSGG